MEPITNNSNAKLNLLVFEFFSGIGGMHEALSQLNNINISKIFPFDINQNANLTYFTNFKINPNAISIESFSLTDYENLIKNNLTNNNIKIEYLPEFFFLENVKNFEVSEANKLLCDLLLEKKYYFLQFLLSPHDFNIPNSRLRFYLIAARINKFNNTNEYLNDITKIIKDKNILFNNINIPKKDIKTFLNINNENDYIKNSSYYLSKEILSKKSCLSMDIVLLKNYSTNCFTKSYTKLFKGSGSILLLKDELYKENLNPIDLLGYIRYFTPNEILKFLCFDDNFIFPNNLSEKAKYKLLGNSVNVKVVNILMNYLFN